MSDKDYGPRVGADPELFVKNLEGEVVPVCGKVGGTKELPLVIDYLVEAQFGAEKRRKSARRRNPLDFNIPAVVEEVERDVGHYAVQEDNVMLEFNIPASSDSVIFQDSITKALSTLEVAVLSPKNLSLKYDVYHSFKAEELEPFPQAFTIGCLPDNDAYAEEGNQERLPFNSKTFGNNRFCGGHFHIQYNKNFVPPHVFAQFMDLAVELPFLRYDKQRLRRLFYGQPGIYREKPYGIEYRTPSNFWLTRDFREKYLAYMVENIFYIARMANTNPTFLKNIYSKVDWHEVQEAIKGENVKTADEIVNYLRSNLSLGVNAIASIAPLR